MGSIYIYVSIPLPWMVRVKIWSSHELRSSDRDKSPILQKGACRTPAGCLGQAWKAKELYLLLLERMLVRNISATRKINVQEGIYPVQSGARPGSKTCATR